MIRNQGILSAIGLITMAAIMLLALNEWRDRPGPAGPEREPPPALIVENVSARTFTPEGHLQYDMRAERIIELDARNETRVDNPRLALHDPELSWEVSASEGQIRNRGREVTLQGNVEARDHGPEGLLIRTETLIYDSTEDRLHGPEEVRITHPGGETRAGGLEADTAGGVLELKQQVESRYDPT